MLPQIESLYENYDKWMLMEHRILIKRRKQISRKNRHLKKLFDNQYGLCYYCFGLMVLDPKCPQTFKNKCTLEHLVTKIEDPNRSRYSLENTRAACYKCNNENIIKKIRTNPEFKKKADIHTKLKYQERQERKQKLYEQGLIPKIIIG